jgi:hypothetical protein
MPYALCPMPYALCPMPYAQSYLIFLRKAIYVDRTLTVKPIANLTARLVYPLTKLHLSANLPR